MRLAPESVVRQHEFFLALDARQDQRNLSREAIVSVASVIEPAWLEEVFPQEIRRERQAVYDEQRDRVVGRGAMRYRDLSLREDKDAAVDAETAAAVLAARVPPVRAWELLREDERAQRWFSPSRAPRRRRCRATGTMSGLTVRPARSTPSPRRREASDRSRSCGRRCSTSCVPGCSYPLDRLLEIEAPETIEVPTGNRIRLDYPRRTIMPATFSRRCSRSACRSCSA